MHIYCWQYDDEISIDNPDPAGDDAAGRRELRVSPEHMARLAAAAEHAGYMTLRNALDWLMHNGIVPTLVG